MALTANLASVHFGDYEAKREELTRNFFEPKLEKMGLSEDQINSQNLDDLNRSLEKIDSAIAHPEGFGTPRYKIFPSITDAMVYGSGENEIQLNIIPILLERKSLILTRISTLAGEKRSEGLTGLIATVGDPELRARIEKEVSGFADQSKLLSEQGNALAQAQAEQISQRDEALSKLRAELFERKLRAWTGFFARESMATYIGALLLLILTIVQIVLIFFPGTAKNEVINNAFLIILGYFFGQSVSRSSSGGPNDPR